jgi:hypothetical protein
MGWQAMWVLHFAERRSSRRRKASATARTRLVPHIASKPCYGAARVRDCIDNFEPYFDEPVKRHNSEYEPFCWRELVCAERG